MAMKKITSSIKLIEKLDRDGKQMITFPFQLFDLIKMSAILGDQEKIKW